MPSQGKVELKSEKQLLYRIEFTTSSVIEAHYTYVPVLSISSLSFLLPLFPIASTLVLSSFCHDCTAMAATKIAYEEVCFVRME